MSSYKQLYETAIKKNRLMVLCWKRRDIPLFANIFDQLIEGEVKEATTELLDDVICSLDNDLRVLKVKIDECKVKIEGLIYADNDPTADEIFDARANYKSLQTESEDKTILLNSYERIADLATNFVEKGKDG